MIHSALAFFFQIRDVTPVKAVWVAMTLANVGMTAWLAMKDSSRFPFAAYMALMAACSMLQGSPIWNPINEVILAAWTIPWVWSMLPRDRYGRIFALAIGALVGSALMFALPPPWPHYPPEMYYTRLYSTAIFLGCVFATCLIESPKASTIIAMPWFGAVLAASAQRGVDRWTMAIWTNLIWTLCLICWMAISRRDAVPDTSTAPQSAASVPSPQSPAERYALRLRLTRRF